MFIEEIFSITTWNQHKCPLTDEHIKKMWYVYTVEYYSLIKRSGFHLQQQGWMFSSVQFSRTVMSGSLWSHGLQHIRPPCPSPTPRVYSNSCPLSQWCHPAISSSVVPFCSRLQSFLKVRWVYNSNKHLRWFQCSLKCNNHFYEINVLFSWKPSFKSLTQKLVFVTKNMDITLSLFYS